jgi:DNA-binding IclR family transcriptional regulator
MGAEGEVALGLSVTATDERARSGDEVRALAARVVEAARGLTTMVGGAHR